MDSSLTSLKKQMQETTDHFKQELAKIRTGRANPQMLQGVMVDVYGQQTPLEHAATVNAVDAQLLQITPYDPNNLDTYYLEV
jgi:ribosome recycling factor